MVSFALDVDLARRAELAAAGKPVEISDISWAWDSRWRRLEKRSRSPNDLRRRELTSDLPFILGGERPSLQPCRSITA